MKVLSRKVKGKADALRDVEISQIQPSDDENDHESRVSAFTRKRVPTLAYATAGKSKRKKFIVKK